MNPFLRVLAILSLLAAAALAVVAYYLARQPTPVPVREMTQQDSEPEPRVELARAVPAAPVVVASRDLKAGETLSASALKVLRWENAPAHAYADPAELLDKTLRFDVREGQPLAPFLLTRGLSNYLQANQRAIDVSVLPATDWRGIRPGDLVDVFFTLSRSPEVGATQSRLLLSRARILAYGARSMDRPMLSKDEDQGDKAPTHAVIAVPQEQVSVVLLASSKGQLQFALRSVHDTSAPDPELFPERDRVLAGRPDLNEADRQRLKDPANLAYAGESLGEVAGTDAAAPRPVAEAAPGTAQRRRSIQIIRGNLSMREPY